MRIAAQVVDSTYGQCAAGVRARLERVSDDEWIKVADAETGGDGRIEDWDSWRLERGVYRIVFDSDSYFAGFGASTAYPEVVVIFRMRSDSENCQVQVALSPYSYSTYFGTIDGHPAHSG
jgi:5-hydroxyisourate hydrolase